MLTKKDAIKCFYIILFTLTFFTLVLTFYDDTHFIGIKDKSLMDKIFNRLYFVITTLSSANYGDIMPRTRDIKLISMIIQLIIIFGVFTIFIKF